MMTMMVIDLTIEILAFVKSNSTQSAKIFNKLSLLKNFFAKLFKLWMETEKDIELPDKIQFLVYFTLDGKFDLLK